MPLGVAIQTYLVELSVTGRARSTIETYGFLLNKAARALGEERPVNTVSRAEVIDYLAALGEAGSSQAYLGLNSRVVKCFGSWLREHDLIKLNPLEGLRIGSQPWNPVAPFSDEEIRRLSKAAETPMEKLTLLLLLDCGLRASELANLRVENFDLKARQINIVGKGQKARKVALNPEPYKALLDYFSSQAQVNGLLWPEGWHRRKLARLLDRLGRRAHVSRVFPHRFRHTFASRFLAASGDALALKQLLGHSSLMMTNRYVQAAEGDRAVTVHKRYSLVA